MKKCSICKKKMKEKTAKTPEGVGYAYYQCEKCQEEMVDMKQLHSVAEKYRTLKKYEVKLSKWGLSLGLRIPKELVDKYHLRDNEDVSIIPEEKGIRIITS